jgi:hypothetical protein
VVHFKPTSQLESDRELINAVIHQIGAPAKPIRLMAGLLILKQINLSGGYLQGVSGNENS